MLNEKLLRDFVVAQDNQWHRKIFRQPDYRHEAPHIAIDDLEKHTGNFLTVVRQGQVIKQVQITDTFLAKSKGQMLSADGFEKGDRIQVRPNRVYNSWSF